MTPVEIEVLLHYNCNANIHPNSDTSGVAAATERFMKSGILDDDLSVTAKGKKLVEMLCETPYPIVKWADPRKEIEYEDLENHRTRNSLMGVTPER